MLHVEHLAPKVFMAHDYVGNNWTEGWGWAAPVYYKKERATPHPGYGMYSLQYDTRPDWSFWARIGTSNIGSLSQKGGEVCEELRKRMIDVCCLKLRWRIEY